MQLREFKDEYEKVSEWLQVMELEVKAQKTVLKGTIEEKEAVVRHCKVHDYTYCLLYLIILTHFFSF